MGISKLIYANKTLESFPSRTGYPEGSIAYAHAHTLPHHFNILVGDVRGFVLRNAMVKLFTPNCLCPDIWALDRAAHL